MKPIFIGVTGTSGAGKTTLCESLIRENPETFGMIQLDDYFKPADMVPVLEGFENWDDPDALYLDNLANDLDELSQGNSIKAMTKNASRNPDYKKTQKRILSVFEPKPVMLVEGFLCLYQSEIREHFTHSVWLELEPENGWDRRSHFKIDGYYEKVFFPSFKKYVEPTKVFASEIIDVRSMSPADIKNRVLRIIGIGN